MILEKKQGATKAQAQKVLKRWRADPVTFVREAFEPVGDIEVEPDEWQVDALRAVATDQRVAMSACKGPGKSCLLAWIIWWFLLTHQDAQVIAISVTQDNLKDNLWKELAKWQQRSPILTKLFEHKAERITSRERPKTWWVSARAFSQQADAAAQANTLAGFHGENVMIVLDEVGDYPDGVVVAAEGIFANEDIQAHLVVAGNPTKIDGPLYRITTRDRSRWTTIHITGDPDDPKRSPRISLTWAREQIELWGRGNPMVMVNVLGLFPPQGEDQLISANDVMKAQRRNASALSYRDDAVVWGLDPARYGLDASCLARRQGTVCFKFNLWRNIDGPTLATRIGELLLKVEGTGRYPDIIFVDVGGVGSSVYDHMKLLGWGHIVRGIDFGSKADDGRFLNKRAEIWWRMARWMQTKPANLPTDPDLSSELTSPKFKYATTGKRTTFKLESKEDMKKRGLKSPNKADSLALTFSDSVASRTKARMMEIHGVAGKVVTGGNPYDNNDKSKGADNYFDPIHART